MCVEHNIAITGLAAKALNVIDCAVVVSCMLWQLFAR